MLFWRWYSLRPAFGVTLGARGVLVAPLVSPVRALETPRAPQGTPGACQTWAWHGNGKSIAFKELVLRATGSASNRFRRQANGFTGKRRLSSSVVVCRRLLLFVVVSRRLPRNFRNIFQGRVQKWYAVVCRRLPRKGPERIKKASKNNPRMAKKASGRVCKGPKSKW